MLPRLHARMGGSGLRQREAAVHYRSQFPFSYERPDGFFQLIRDHRLETYRARAEGGPGQGQPPAHHIDDRNVRFRPTLGSDGHMAAVLSQARQIASDIIRSEEPTSELQSLMRI